MTRRIAGDLILSDSDGLSPAGGGRILGGARPHGRAPGGRSRRLGSFLVLTGPDLGGGDHGVLAFGWSEHNATRLDPLYLTLPFDDVFSNLLVAPAARFDSAWYLTIAQHGYDGAGRPAFFPLLPALIRLMGDSVGAQVLAGVALSSLCGFGGLYLLHRLVSLDFDLSQARSVVWLAAWFPGALVLSAVYTESLFLVLPVGSIYAARLGKWPVAGLLGGIAAAGPVGPQLHPPGRTCDGDLERRLGRRRPGRPGLEPTARRVEPRRAPAARPP